MHGKTGWRKRGAASPGRQSGKAAGNPVFNQCCTSQRVEYGDRLWKNNVKFYRQDREIFLMTPISVFIVSSFYLGGIRGFSSIDVDSINYFNPCNCPVSSTSSSPFF